MKQRRQKGVAENDRRHLDKLRGRRALRGKERTQERTCAPSSYHDRRVFAGDALIIEAPVWSEPPPVITYTCKWIDPEKEELRKIVKELEHKELALRSETDALRQKVEQLEKELQHKTVQLESFQAVTAKLVKGLAIGDVSTFEPEDLEVAIAELRAEAETLEVPALEITKEDLSLLKTRSDAWVEVWKLCEKLGIKEDWRDKRVSALELVKLFIKRQVRENAIRETELAQASTQLAEYQVKEIQEARKFATELEADSHGYELKKSKNQRIVEALKLSNFKSSLKK